MNKQSILATLAQFESKTILVIGDLMLDAYIWGDALRISPEAPVPVVNVASQDFMPGGAANVARNLRSLGANVLVCGLVGKDPEGDRLIGLLTQTGIQSDLILQSSDRPTSVKTRVIARGQHVVRYDREISDLIDERAQTEIIHQIAEILDTVDGIILEDYNKGLFSENLISKSIKLAGEKGLPIYVDPKKRFFSSYRNIRLLKPNWGEFSNVIGSFSSEDEFIEQGTAFRKQQHIDTLIVTRGSEGMTLFNESGIRTIPTHAREVHDVSGAGDTVIATYALSDTTGLSGFDSASIANLAAGIVCEEVGVVPITTEKLKHRIHELISDQS
ncbi:MAG: D-glycero-beta-D-manno-heptose-7-phosphate kinase [FCB group bacterium]|nr:D-glycero-beta-D-manno-heptose-7-phosphate kinase [FCB group bacterium]